MKNLKIKGEKQLDKRMAQLEPTGLKTLNLKLKRLGL